MISDLNQGITETKDNLNIYPASLDFSFHYELRVLVQKITQSLTSGIRNSNASQAPGK